MKKLILCIALLPFLSCKNALEERDVGLRFYFESPQPANDPELSVFPNKFRGMYRNADSTFITISDKLIVSEHDYGFRIHKKDLDSLRDIFEFVNGKLIDKETNKPIESHFVGDSLQISNKQVDTLFYISATNKVKRIHGDLILNRKDSVFWKIKILRLEKDVLKIKYLYSLEDVRRIDSISKSKARKLDSVSYLFKPERKEFKNILKVKGLGAENEFKKISR
ncbi:hypothetical protein [Flavobacterium humi]|uniref:hypothetical protein n=1 Tax=Flavobacterium humi TaxID=2562683 RepID=UPI00146F2FCE|nr:hypothetical protein [Flavobacterium humi]